VTPREAQPSELNPVHQLVPGRLRKPGNRGGRHGSIAKRFSGNPDAEKRKRNSKMLRGQKKVPVSSLESTPRVGKEDGRAGATAMRKRPYQSLF
jgi:hypothetical protein